MFHIHMLYPHKFVATEQTVVLKTLEMNPKSLSAS